MKVSNRAKAIILAVLLGIGLLNALAKWEPQIGQKPSQTSQDITPVNRADTMALLFEEFCIGALRHMAPDPQGQLQRQVVNGQPTWVDAGAGLSLILGQVPPKTCTISDDLRPLSVADRGAFAQIVAQKMPIWMPQAAPRDLPSEAGVMRREWAAMDGTFAITLRQPSNDGATKLTIRLPTN